MVIRTCQTSIKAPSCSYMYSVRNVIINRKGGSVQPDFLFYCTLQYSSRGANSFLLNLIICGTMLFVPCVYSTVGLVYSGHCIRQPSAQSSQPSLACLKYQCNPIHCTSAVFSRRLGGPTGDRVTWLDTMHRVTVLGLLVVWSSRHKIQAPVIMGRPKFEPRPWQQFPVTAPPDNKHCPLNR